MIRWTRPCQGIERWHITINPTPCPSPCYGEGIKGRGYNNHFIMKINVKFFALGKELVGNSSLEIEMEVNSNVQSLLESLKSKHPKLNELKSFLVAVNMEYADMEKSLKDGDEVAIIPPVSGG